MKKADDPRHIRRIRIIEALFAQSFSERQDGNYLDLKDVIVKIKSLIKDIDPLIEKAAPQFPITKIAKIDVAILRLAIFELLFDRKEPEKVIIDESVELAKLYGGEASPSFVNGVLGNILLKEK